MPSRSRTSSSPMATRSGRAASARGHGARTDLKPVIGRSLPAPARLDRTCHPSWPVRRQAGCRAAPPAVHGLSTARRGANPTDDGSWPARHGRMTDVRPSGEAESGTREEDSTGAQGDPMGTITVGRENSAPIELYYEDHGSGPRGRAAARLAVRQPVLGAAGAPAARRPGHRVITYDRRGFGRSSRPSDGLRLRHARRRPRHACSRELDLRDVTLVGFSLGTGELARYIGTLRHRPAAGAACSSRASRRRSSSPTTTRTASTRPAVAGRPAGDPRRPVRVADRADRATSSTSTSTSASGSARTPCARSGTPAPRRRRCATWACPPGWLDDFSDDIERIDVPTLILHGTADRILSIDGQGRRLHAALPDAHYVEIDGGPHVMCVTHAAEVNRELLAFLRSRRRPPRCRRAVRP